MQGMMFTLNNLDGIPDDKYIDKFIDITYNIIRQMLKNKIMEERV